MKDNFKPMVVPLTKAQKAALEALYSRVEVCTSAFYEAAQLMSDAKKVFWGNAREMGITDDVFVYSWHPEEKQMRCNGLSLAELGRKKREENEA